MVKESLHWSGNHCLESTLSHKVPMQQKYNHFHFDFFLHILIISKLHSLDVYGYILMLAWCFWLQVNELDGINVMNKPTTHQKLMAWIVKG